MASANNTFDSFAIASTRVVTPSGVVPAAVVIDRGMIVDVVPIALVADNISIVDFGDLVISPGVVDAHVHVNQPGRTDWEGFESATSAAAAGGVTTIVDMPLNSSPVTTTVEALQAKRSAASGLCRVDVGFFGGLVPGNTEQLQSLLHAGVLGIKTFLCDSGLDEFPASGEQELNAALEILQETGVPLLVHAEIVSESNNIEDVQSYQQYAASRPAEFELRAIRLMIELCRKHNTPVHIVHLAAAAALEEIVAAKKEGLPISVETCPHYLYFSDSQINDGETQYKCAPPIRDSGNRAALRDAVLHGVVETIGSDHSPCPVELKRLDSCDFAKAWGGISGLQLTLPIVWTVAKENDWSLELVAERLSSRPAQLFGLSKRKGQIAAGMDADFVVWDPSSRFEVCGESLFHRHKVTPYEGRELSGMVRKTYLRGQLIFDLGELVGDPIGELLVRESTEQSGVAVHLNALSTSKLAETLETCCASNGWINAMVTGGRFADDNNVVSRAENSWARLDEREFLESFSAHPKIGDVESLRKKYANTKAIAKNEQSGVQAASEETLNRLAALNEAYFDIFGFIFIVCATGKSASEMLEILEQRIGNDRETELKNAAAEQLKITILRLGKLNQ